MNNKSLLIYNQPKIKKLFTSYPSILSYCGSILDVYFAKVYNPPFFQTLLYVDPEQDPLFIKNKEEFIKKAWNITLLNGHLLIPNKYQSLLPYPPKEILTVNRKKYNLYHKIENKLFIFYDKYRTVDFMIIGVEKSGTTSVMNHLSKHPDIFIAQPEQHPGKEMHYYNYHWTKGEKWYKSFFNYKYKMVGEKNPNIIYLDYLYPYIQSINPCVKMILFLRNPIDRAYSAWHLFHVRNQTYIHNENRKTFEEMINDELENRLDEPLNFYVSYDHLLQKGLYFQQLQKLYRYFPKQNVCIQFLHEIEKNPQKVYQDIFNFLDVPPFKSPSTIELKGIYNTKQKNKDISPALRKKLINFYKEDTMKLEKMLNVKTNWF